MKFKYFLFITLILSTICVINVNSDRVKRIVGGDPASRPPPPGSVNFVDENYPGDVSLSTSTTPEPDFEESSDAVVFPRYGTQTARVTGVKQDGHYAFKGLKYAQPPVGMLRFQRPVRLYMFGNILATKFGPPCPQPLPNNKGVIGQEDCLYLNVFTPKLPKRGEKKDGGLPVIFWIHGGGFRRGSGSQYSPKNLVNKGVVVVTVQYRLGSLGFLNRKNKDLPGNVGMFDINAALKWVKEYIRYFGGNPYHIVLSGQGSGGSAACMLASSRFNTESVKGVFAMSGSSISSFAIDEKENVTANEVAEINKCKDDDNIKFIRCMQKVSYEKIVEADNQFQDKKIEDGTAVKAMSSPLNPSPNVEGADDGRFLPFFNNLPPIEALKSGNFIKVPLLTGVTKEETSTCVKGNLFGKVTQLLSEVEDVLSGGIYKELLSSNTGLYSNGSINPTLGTLFNSQDYLSAMTNSLTSAVSQVEKLVEMTTDALFNLPAFLTSQLWAKKSDAFLYQFDHQSDKSNGKLFLDGLPLVQTEENQPSKGLGHGDDLIYLFEPCTLEGEPIKEGELASDEDKKVRDYFTSMVAEFAKTGKPVIKEAGISGWTPFKDESSEYLELSDKPKVKSGFRKCQMALWAGLGQALKSAECSALNAGELIQSLTGAASSNLLEPISLKNVGSTLTQPLNGLSSGLSNPTKILTNPVGGLLGAGGNNNNKNDNTGNANPVGGLLGFGGNSNNRPQQQKQPQIGNTGNTNSVGSLLGLGGNNNNRPQQQKPLGGLFGR